MRKLLVLCMAFLAIWSCKKDNTIGKIQFEGTINYPDDSLYYDSAEFLRIAYLKLPENISTQEFYDSSFYKETKLVPLIHSSEAKSNHSLVSDLLTFETGRYLLKKFDFLDKGGKILYNVKYIEGLENIDSTSISGIFLPLPFRVEENPYSLIIPIKAK